MDGVNRYGQIRNAKRLVLGLVLLSLASALVAGSYLMMSQDQKPLSAAEFSAPRELSSSLFRLPLDAQESLFVRMFCGLDAQEDSAGRYGVVEYGIGTEASRIGKRLGKQHFGDANHALWSVYRSASLKGDPKLVEQLIPVNLADRSFQVALPSDARPKGCRVIRLRKQIDSSGSERTQQAESADLKWLPEAGWQTQMEVRYLQGSEGNPSVLQVRSKALSKLSSGTNWWVVAWFNAEAPRNEQLVIVGVLAGQFVNRDGTIRLKAGEAACIRLRHTAPSRKVEYIQPAELRLQGDQWMLRWDAAVASGYRLLMVQLYAVPSPLPVLANSLEEWSKLSRGAITLDASWYWAPQKPAYYPDF